MHHSLYCVISFTMDLLDPWCWRNKLSARHRQHLIGRWSWGSPHRAGPARGSDPCWSRLHRCWSSCREQNLVANLRNSWNIRTSRTTRLLWGICAVPARRGLWGRKEWGPAAAPTRFAPVGCEGWAGPSNNVYSTSEHQTSRASLPPSSCSCHQAANSQAEEVWEEVEEWQRLALGFWLPFCSSEFPIRICAPRILSIKSSCLLMMVTALTL